MAFITRDRVIGFVVGAIAAFLLLTLIGSRWHLTSPNGNGLSYRLDRWSGEVVGCHPLGCLDSSSGTDETVEVDTSAAATDTSAAPWMNDPIAGPDETGTTDTGGDDYKQMMDAADAVSKAGQ